MTGQRIPGGARRPVRTVLAAAVIVALAGCFLPFGGADPVDVAPDLLIGLWHSDRRDATIEFTSTGDFYTDDAAVLVDDDPDTTAPAPTSSRLDRIAGSGRWAIGDWSERAVEADSRIRLSFEVRHGKPVATGTELFAERIDGRVALVYYIGDPDSGNTVVYRRCANCRRLAPDRKPPGERADVTVDQVAGPWRDKKSGSVLRLDPDGTFQGDDFSFLFVNDRFAPMPVRGRISGAGTWKLEKPGWDQTGPTSELHLIFTTRAGQKSWSGSRPIRIFQVAGGLAIVNWTSDPTVYQERVYTRCGDCPN